ncbi:MAG: UbiA family prenyltransferase [Candidatus Omnitrophica bacterium]|nr:UbiA family prenyltransferase [Candidatus Omnitrophota bacterium]MBU1935180.1 UbiA family prenyltransferase [Patescibacteria group bacterium]
MSLLDNSLFLACRECVKLYRIESWFYLLGLVLFGYFYSSSDINATELALILISASCYLGYGYCLNEVFDRKGENGRIESYAISLKYGILCSFIILLPLFVCISLLSHNKNQIFIVFVLGILSGYLYSAEPFRFKSRPFLDLIFNSLCFANLFLFGAVCKSRINIEAFLLFIYFFVLFLPVQICHEISHSHSDQKNNIKNSLYYFGIKNVKQLLILNILIFFLYCLYLVFAISLNKYFIYVTAIFCLALFITAMHFNKSELRNKLKNITRILSMLYLLVSFAFIVKKA